MLCSGCGQPRDESMRDVESPDFIGYDAIPVRCNACREINRAAREFAKVDERDPSAGISWGLERSNGHVG